MSRVKPLNGTAAAVLAYLHSGPQSGWDIRQGLQSLIGDFWNITPSQIYRELRALTEAGLVTPGPTGPRDRRPYTITPAGTQALRSWRGQPPERDTVRIPVLLRLFLAFTAGDATDDDITTMLGDYRADHAATLQAYQAKLAELEDMDLPHKHLIAYGIAHEQAVLGWLDNLPWQ